MGGHLQGSEGAVPRDLRLTCLPAGASTEKVLEEKNALTLFITGAYRNDDLPTQKKLIQVAKIRELDTVKGGNYDPRQRRNPGAPSTSEIEAQMGTQVYALYQPLKPGGAKPINAK